MIAGAPSKLLIFPTDMVVAEYLKKVNSSEREQLKFDLVNLTTALHKHNIVVPFSFQPYLNTYSSETLDRDLSFLYSSGIITKKEGSIIYEITENGKEILKNKEQYFKGIPSEALNLFEHTLDDLFVPKAN
jgi:hypothetical protein